MYGQETARCVTSLAIRSACSCASKSMMRFAGDLQHVAVALWSAMNLVVASRQTGPLIRFDVEGRWRDGDALKLAYLIKAAVTRVRQDHVLIDLRRVAAPPGAQGKFQICDRLRRALNANMRIGVIARRDLVDADEPGAFQQCPEIGRFDGEGAAIKWLSAQPGG